MFWKYTDIELKILELAENIPLEKWENCPDGDDIFYYKDDTTIIKVYSAEGFCDNYFYLKIELLSNHELKVIENKSFLICKSRIEKLFRRLYKAKVNKANKNFLHAFDKIELIKK